MLVRFRPPGCLGAGWFGCRSRVPHQHEGFPAGGERTFFWKVLSLCLLFQALSTLEDWFGSAWPKRSGTPGPSCLDSTEGFPSSKKLQLISPAQMKLVFRMVTVLFPLSGPLPRLIRLRTYSL